MATAWDRMTACNGVAPRRWVKPMDEDKAPAARRKPWRKLTDEEKVARLVEEQKWSERGSRRC